MTTKAVDN